MIRQDGSNTDYSSSKLRGCRKGVDDKNIKPHLLDSLLSLVISYFDGPRNGVI